MAIACVGEKINIPLWSKVKQFCSEQNWTAVSLKLWYWANKVRYWKSEVTSRWVTVLTVGGNELCLPLQNWILNCVICSHASLYIYLTTTSAANDQNIYTYTFYRSSGSVAVLRVAGGGGTIWLIHEVRGRPAGRFQPWCGVSPDLAFTVSFSGLCAGVCCRTGDGCGQRWNDNGQLWCSVCSEDSSCRPRLCWW